MIRCKICNKEVTENKALSIHLRYNHIGYNIQKYYDEFYKKGEEGVCKLEGCNNKTNFFSFEKGYLDHCCNSHAQKNPKIRNKIENTKEVNHGDKNFTNRKKAKETTKERYGNEFYNNRPRCSEKLLNRTEDEKEKWRNKVRTEWNKKSNENKNEISSKRKKTMFEKYGDELYSINKAMKTTKEKYGVVNISQLPEISKKIKETWNNKTKEEIENRTRKIQNTNLSRYGFSHIMYNPEMKYRIIKKSRETKIKLGKWLSDDQIPLFKLYYRRVFYFTSRSAKEKFTSEELSKTGKCGVEGALQIDHILSIKEGFLNNIPPYIIGHKNNLRLISWLENDVKKYKSEISLEALCDSIFEGNV